MSSLLKGSICLYCVYNIVCTIILLTYLGSDESKVRFHDWRRILLLVYSYVTIVMVFLLLYLLKDKETKNVLLLFISPLFQLIVFPIALSILITIYFYTKKETTNVMDITSTGRACAVLLASIILIFSFAILVGILYYEKLYMSIVKKFPALYDQAMPKISSSSRRAPLPPQPVQPPLPPQPLPRLLSPRLPSPPVRQP